MSLTVVVTFLISLTLIRLALAKTSRARPPLEGIIRDADGSAIRNLVTFLELAAIHRHREVYRLKTFFQVKLRFFLQSCRQIRTMLHAVGKKLALVQSHVRVT